MPKKKAAKKKGTKKKWMVAVMVEYRKNKKAGLSAAMKRAKKKWRKT